MDDTAQATKHNELIVAKMKQIERRLLEYHREVILGTVSWDPSIVIQSFLSELVEVAHEESDQWKRAFTLRQDEVAVLRKALEEARTNARDGLLEAKREIDDLKERCEKLEAQLTAEEQCAMESGGILSDVCDLVFDDPERAATHGYEGVKEKIVEMKNQLRLYQLQIDKL